ncbi:MAG: TonB-dependent receptor plug domain-containing protein [Planctomycetia bacterium]|nr:TonB-dependent receptor plug domain-containing protein [Planctomycetia bacterium]
MHFNRYLIIILLSVTIQTGLIAGTTGKIVGRVTDAETGEPLIGLNVIIENTSLGAACDVDGYYYVLNVPPGTYSVKLMMIGYRETIVTNVQVSSDRTTTVDAQISQIVLDAEAVIVVAQRSIIEMDRTSTESSVSGEQIDMMPVETIDDILNLQAGVVDGHFRGGRLKEVVYQIDGVPINDSYTGEAALDIETDIIKELKVISGTFNAEYGQAQSGIVDIITKERNPTLTGRVSFVSGDYVSTRKDIFWNINDLNPRDYLDYSLFLSGPVGEKSGYLFSYRRVADNGFIYGKNVFLPVDSISFGDNSYIPMGYNNRATFFGKMTIALTNYDKLSLSISHQTRGQNRDYGIYDHLFRYNPLGQGASDEQTLIGIASWSHIFSDKSFINIRAAINKKDYEQYLYKDSLDSRYAADWRLRLRGNFSFYTGGTDNSYFTRSGIVKTLKGDFTSQITRYQLIKTGFDIKQHNLTLYDVELKKNSETNWEVQIPPSNSADNQQYKRSPLEMAAYIQTKWEYDSFILNLGLRYDYFNSNGEIIEDLTRPRTSPLKPAKPIHQLSPRIGIAYPITDKGVLHVSYGHFFQIPEFEFLYTNPSRTVNPEEGLASVFNYPFGNADLQPQKTVGYEIGLQQQVGETIALDITAYYKDIRNLLGTEINAIAIGEEHSSIQYGRYVNRDYGQVKGLTLMLERKLFQGIGASIDYTYQVARGNASDPRDILLDLQSDPPVESEKQLVPLDWDQTHSLNGQINFQTPTGLTFTLVGKIGSGMPYTPTTAKITSIFENSDQKPFKMTFDLYTSKDFKIGSTFISLYLKIYNIFDRLNEKDVYGDSGRATYTKDLNEPGEVQGLNTKEEYFNRPDWYGPPRRILFGISSKF